MKIFKLKNNKGYALLEMVFYIALFALMSLVIINSMLTMTSAFKETKIQNEFMQGANIMERISRGIKSAYDINTISANSLKLNDDPTTVNSTIRFSLSGNNIEYYEDDVLIGNLNAPNISVSNLSFTQITTAQGEAVKVVLTITSTNDSLARPQDFYNTVVLRGSY